MYVKFHRGPFRVGLVAYWYGVIVKLPFRRQIIVIGRR